MEKLTENTHLQQTKSFPTLIGQRNLMFSSLKLGLFRCLWVVPQAGFIQGFGFPLSASSTNMIAAIRISSPP